MRPLLRINDWATLEATQKLERHLQVIRSLEAQLTAAEQELAASYRQIQASLAEGQGIDKGRYELGSNQAAGWLRTVRRIRAQRESEIDKLQKLQSELAELKRKRNVIERRREELAREYEAALNAQSLAEQDDLWLSRGLT